MEGTCGICKGTDYTEDNPFVEVRMPRPSDPNEMTCVVAGHAHELGAHVVYGEVAFVLAATYGVGTPSQWEVWAEKNPHRRLG